MTFNSMFSKLSVTRVRGERRSNDVEFGEDMSSTLGGYISQLS